MRHGERLAAYLADALGEEDRRALERELAEDPELRRQLDAIRRLDERLSALPAVEPPAAFRERLRDTVRAELAERAAVERTDELARQRRRRRERRFGWMPALGAAAAAVAVLAGVTVTLGGFGGDDGGGELAGSEVADTAEAQDGAAEAAAGGETARDAAAADDAGPTTDDVTALEADRAADAPLVVAQGNRYDRGGLAAAAGLQAAEELRDRTLPPGAFAAVRERYATAFAALAAPSDVAAEPREDPGQAAAAEAAPEVVAPAVEGELLPADRRTIARCVSEFLRDRDAVIVASVELATVAGEAALVLGIVRDGTLGADVADVAVLDPTTCGPLPAD